MKKKSYVIFYLILYIQSLPLLAIRVPEAQTCLWWPLLRVIVSVSVMNIFVSK